MSRLLLTFASALLLTTAPAADLPSLDTFRDPEVTKIFESIPVQESGRIKPLEKVANTRLLGFHGSQTAWLTDNGKIDGKPLVDPATQKPIVNEKGKTAYLTGVQWLLVSWLRPDLGRIIPLFSVDNSSAVAELGLPTKSKRDQYTYAEIEPAREVLM